MNVVARAASFRLARFLQRRLRNYHSFSVSGPERLRRFLLPGDILLVDGDQWISVAIKYLTQSTWSHAAFYAGEEALAHLPESPSDSPNGGGPCSLIEMDFVAGARAVPLSAYARHNTRICRPLMLSPEDRDRVIAFMVAHLDTDYDLRNVTDLLRYLLPIPPVPSRFRRRMLSFGSGEPTRAICSSLIARAFHSVNYPILPEVEIPSDKHSEERLGRAEKEILHIRHHSLFVPRDFDLSPYFSVVKPTMEAGFDPRQLKWYDRPEL